MGVTLINNILSAYCWYPFACHLQNHHRLTKCLCLRNACPQVSVMTPVNTKASRHSLLWPGQVCFIILFSSLTGINSVVRADRKLTYDLTCCASSDHYLRKQPCLKFPLRGPAPHFTCATNNPDYIFLWHSKPPPPR